MTMIMNDVTAFEMKLTLIKNIKFFYIHKMYNMVIFIFIYVPCFQLIKLNISLK